MIGDLGQGRCGSQRSLESQRRPTALSFDLRPAKNEPKENSQEFSQVKAAAHQQGVYAVAVFALQVVSFHPVVLFQVTNHWLDGRASAQETFQPATQFSTRDVDRDVFWMMLAATVAFVDEHLFRFYPGKLGHL